MDRWKRLATGEARYRGRPATEGREADERKARGEWLATVEAGCRGRPATEGREAG